MFDPAGRSEYTRQISGVLRLHRYQSRYAILQAGCQGSRMIAQFYRSNLKSLLWTPCMEEGMLAAL